MYHIHILQWLCIIYLGNHVTAAAIVCNILNLTLLFDIL